MKKAIVFIVVLVLAFALVACNGADAKEIEQQLEEAGILTPGTSTGDPDVDTSETNPSTDTSQTQPSGGASGSSSGTLETYKTAALAVLSNSVTTVQSKTTDTDLLTAIRAFYAEEVAYVQSIVDAEVAKAAAEKIAQDTIAFAKDTLMPIALRKLDATVTPLIQKITKEDLKASVQTFYETQKNKLSSVATLDDVVTFFNSVVADTKAFIKSESEKILVELKNKAIEELDPIVSALIEKIPYDAVKTSLQAFYLTEKEKLAAVSEFDGFAPCVAEIKKDLAGYALSESKKLAVAELNAVIDAGLEKLPNQELKNDLSAFAQTELQKLNEVETFDALPEAIKTILKETKAHVTSLLAGTVKEYVARVTTVERTTAYDYLPAAMNPNQATRAVAADSIAYDFTVDTAVSSINKAGFGEQWQMVVENVDQSVKIAKVLNWLQTALNAAATAVDIYIENSYAEEMNYEFEGEKFEAKFAFKDGVFSLHLALTEAIEVPLFGSIRPVLNMKYDMVQDEKTTYLSLGDNYKLLYVIQEDQYDLSLTYGLSIGGKSASRTSELLIEVAEDKSVTGHINEYTTLLGADRLKACADFYVKDGYVSVVGNKASGMVAFAGYINELYLANEGRLLGYEVKETQTIAGITLEYDTLWFNLWDIGGIDLIKVTEKSEENESARSTVDTYLNGSDKLLAPTYNTQKVVLVTVKTSRKYDVELRTRYYYTYDPEGEIFAVNGVDVPMLFVQEDCLETFSADLLKDNGVTASVSLNNAYLKKIVSDHKELIEIFIQNKENISSTVIVEKMQSYE